MIVKRNNNSSPRIHCADKTLFQLVRAYCSLPRLFVLEWQHRRVYKQKNTPATVFIDNKASKQRCVKSGFEHSYFRDIGIRVGALCSVFSLCAFNFECAN